MASNSDFNFTFSAALGSVANTANIIRSAGNGPTADAVVELQRQINQLLQKLSGIFVDTSDAGIQAGTIVPADFAPGFSPIQNVNALPVLPNAAYPIGSVVFLTTDGKLYRNFGNVWTASIGSGDIATPLTNTNFSLTLRPVYVVTSLPALPDPNYPIGSLAFLTTDGKLYRNVANVWTAAVPTVDLTGQITTTQITAGAVTSPLLAANAVVAGKIAANAVTAGTIAANGVIAGNITAGSIRSTDAVFALAAIQNADINTLSASKLTAGTIDAAVISVINLNASNIISGTITGAQVFLSNFNIPGHGSSGMNTDLRQTIDAATGLDTGVTISQSSNANNRIVMGFDNFIGLHNAAGNAIRNFAFLNNVLTLYTTGSLSATASLILTGGTSLATANIQIGNNFALTVASSGKKKVGGFAQLSSGTFSLNTGLSSIDYITVNPIFGATGLTENIYPGGSPSGGTMSIFSSNAASTTFFYWQAVGNQ